MSASSHDATHDTALLSAFVNGDHFAFAALFERYTARLNHLACRYLQPTDALDAVQNVFIELLERAPRILEQILKYNGSLRYFMFTALRRTIRNKNTSRWTRMEEFNADWPSPDGDELAALLQHEDMQRFGRIFEGTCTPIEREVLTLGLRNLAIPHIAEIVGVSISAVRKAQHRAIVKLRSALADHDAIPPYSRSERQSHYLRMPSADVRPRIGALPRSTSIGIQNREIHFAVWPSSRETLNKGREVYFRVRINGGGIIVFACDHLDVLFLVPGATVVPRRHRWHLPMVGVIPSNVMEFCVTPRRGGPLAIEVVLLVRNEPIYSQSITAMVEEGA